MNEKFKQISGLSREAEEQKLAEVIEIAQSNLEKAQEDISKMDDYKEKCTYECFGNLSKLKYCYKSI